MRGMSKRDWNLADKRLRCQHPTHAIMAVCGYNHSGHIIWLAERVGIRLQDDHSPWENSETYASSL